MWLKVDTVQVEALRQILALLSPLSRDRVSIKVLPNGPSVDVIDVSIPGEDIGVALLPTQISIGSRRHNIDNRHELADYDNPEMLVIEGVRDFGAILIAHGILAHTGGEVPRGTFP